MPKPSLSATPVTDFDVNTLSPNPHADVDYSVVAKYPGEVVAVYSNGRGIIYDKKAKAEPIHAATIQALRALMKRFAPGEWTYVTGPVK